MKKNLLISVFITIIFILTCVVFSFAQDKPKSDTEDKPIVKTQIDPENKSIKWDANKDAEMYKVEIAKDENFKDIVISEFVKTTEYKFNLPDGKYFLQVKVVLKNFEGPSSGVNPFNIGIREEISKLPSSDFDASSVTGNSDQFENVYYDAKKRIHYVPINRPIKPKLDSKVYDTKEIKISLNHEPAFKAFDGVLTFHKEGKVKVNYQLRNVIYDMPEEWKLNAHVDATPPKVDIRFPITRIDENNITYLGQDGKFMLEATDEGAGVLLIQYSINGEEWKNYEYKPVAIKEEGPIKIFYRAIDNIGNASLYQAKLVERSLKKPAFKLVAYNNAFVVKDKQLYITMRNFLLVKYDKFNTPVKSITYKIDNGTERTYSDKKGIKFYKMGKCKFTVTVTDLLDNISKEDFDVEVFDKDPNEILITGEKSNAELKKEVEVKS